MCSCSFVRDHESITYSGGSAGSKEERRKRVLRERTSTTLMNACLFNNDDETPNHALGDARIAHWWQLTTLLTTETVLFFLSLSKSRRDARADAIVVGFGFLISATMLTQLSYKVPKWLGVYYWSVEINTAVYEVPTALTVRELRFNVYWSIWKIFAQVYFLMSLQFCAAQPETVPVSATIGICAGLIVYYGIYVGRTRWRDHKYWVAAALAAGLSIAASAAWAYGIYYVQTIWNQATGMSSGAVLASMFFSWAAICIILNVSIWYYTERKKRLGEDNDDDDARMELFAPRSNKHNEQEQGETLQPESESKQASAAASSSLAVGQVVAAASDSNDNNSTNGGDHSEQSNSQEGAQVNLDDVEEGAAADEKIGEGAVKDETEQVAADGMNEKLDGEEEEEQAAGVEDESARVRRLVQEAEENQTFCKLLGAKCCCKCCCCCNKGRNGQRERKSCCHDFLTFCKWFIVFIVNVCCLYVTIVNIGATSEMEVVRYNLPNATRNLYPPDYQNGTMCAWDEPTPNAILKTFDTLDEVYAANWTVAHCEACANCSNWNDMEIQWSTRDTLASTAMAWYVAETSKDGVVL